MYRLVAVGICPGGEAMVAQPPSGVKFGAKPLILLGFFRYIRLSI